jgi:DNA-binding NarL/FixJ family response regulator
MQQIERTETSKARKIFIVEDHPVFRQGLAQLIDEQPDLRVCGEAADAEAALPAIKRVLPDAVLVDITLPGKSGLELIRQLRALPQLKILVVSMHDEALYANRVLQAGAHGYVMKQEDPEEIVDALRDVLAGRIYLSEAVLESRGSTGRGRAKTLKRPLEELTDTELEMLEALGRGKSRKEMAKEFGLSERAITERSGRIRKKLGLRSSSALMRYAVCWVETERSGRG